MRLFPDALGTSPRSQLKLLWRLLPKERLIWVQAAHPWESPADWQVLGELTVPTLVAGQSYSFDVAVACQKTPPSAVPPELREAVKEHRAAAQWERQQIQARAGDRSRTELPKPRGSYRSKKVLVPEVERPDWFGRLLQRRGLVVDPPSLKLSEIERVPLSKRKGALPTVTASFAATAADADLANTALREGVGAGKSYGLGLLTVRNA